MIPNNYIAGNFFWFTGVVEDINDPEEMGRVKVRCYGWHNHDKALVGTDDLPWAQPIMPVTSASMNGIGQSATGLLEGSWVVGFFRDGQNGQDPVIMGSIPAKSTRPDAFDKGFTDPNQRYPDENSLHIPDTPVSARASNESNNYKLGFSYTKKSELRSIYKEIPTANNAESAWSFTPIDEVMVPVYPKNHVINFERADDTDEAAHTLEFDVTPGFERISTIHRTGTFNEIGPKGDKTETIVGNNFQVVVKDNDVYVKGNCNLTVDQNCTTYIKGDWNIEVDGNKIENIHGTLTQTVDKAVTEHYKTTQKINVDSTLDETVGSNVTETYQANLTETVSGNQRTKVSGNIDIDASRIDLN